MLNQTKDILKKKIRANKLYAIRFKKYSEYKNYFISEDKKSNWDPSAFTKIIETHLVNKKKLILVEIGVARGATSLYTINSLKNCIDSYFGIDPYKSNYDKTDIVSSYNQDLMDNCYLYVLDKVRDPKFKLLRLTSENASNLFSDQSIDAIFIDGDHTYEGVTNDINFWKSKIKKGGIIMGDDYNTFSDVKKAVQENFTDINIDNNCWYVKV